MIAGKMAADQYGWKLGQKVPIASNIWPQKNGSKAWAFDLVGNLRRHGRELERSGPISSTCSMITSTRRISSA